MKSRIGHHPLGDDLSTSADSSPRVTLTRRGLLKAAGGAAVASSLLSRVPFAHAAPGRPTRLIVFFTPHGAPQEHFWPTDLDSLASQQSAVSILSPLKPFANQMNVLRGINYVGSDNHPAIHDVLTNKTGTSIDTSIARKLGVKPLRLGVIPDYAQSFTVDGQFAFDGGTALPHVPDPAKAFDGLVADLPAGGGGANPPPQPTGPTPAELRKLALGPAAAELEELKKRAGGTKLDKHISSVQSYTNVPTTGTPGVPVAACTSRPRFDTVEKVRGKNVYAAENFPDIMAAQIDIAAFALRCNLTKVVSIQSGYVNYQIPFNWIGIGDGHHNVSHSSPGSAGRVLHARCQEWYAKQLAVLLGKLNEKDPLDPAHTILENTVVMWCSEIADGQGHTCQSVPTVLIGGGGGYLKQKQIVNLNARSHAGLLLTLCEAMGVSGIDVGNGGADGALREVKA